VGKGGGWEEMGGLTIKSADENVELCIQICSQSLGVNPVHTHNNTPAISINKVVNWLAQRLARRAITRLNLGMISRVSLAQQG
jgi:hypothetical protein